MVSAQSSTDSSHTPVSQTHASHTATPHAASTLDAERLSGASKAQSTQGQAGEQTKMKAISQPAWGGPEVLQLVEVARPQVPEAGVLVRVMAASVHKGDWHMLTGKPYLIRLAGFGFSAPKRTIPGMAVAGRVAAVGQSVTVFKVGDEVFGEIGGGGFAEYVCVTEKELALKPASVSFEDAATLPISSTTALQGLRDAGRLKPGQSVLINGAAGGVGTFAVQLAKALGAEVTAVCSTGNVALVQSLGADHVIDYKQEDFTQGIPRFDVILDLVGNRSATACRRVLKEGGRLVAVAGGNEYEWTGPLFPILTGMAGNLFSSKTFVPLAAKPTAQDLKIVADLVAAGKVKPFIDQRFSLAQVSDALRLQGQGHARGKSVIRVAQDT